MIRFQPLFAGHGELHQAQPGRLVLDMGNQLVPGVIDHHQDSGAGRHDCTATLIMQHPELILDHLRDWPIEQVTVVLHRGPDFDAIAAAYLAQELLTSGVLPPGAAALAAYALQVDSATLPVTDHPEQTPYGLLAGVGRVVDAAPPAGDTPEERADRRDVAVLDRGLTLMGYLTACAAAGHSLTDPTLFAGTHPFMAELAAVRDDYQHYLHDLAAGRVRTLAIPAMDGRGLQPVSLLTVRDPTSALFKVWARQDRRHAPDGHGFVMTSVQYGEHRFVVSVDPAAGVWLRGLGAALDRAETVKRARLGQPRTGPIRPGYDNADPWYDGRAAIHNYTIIDAPRAGTVLTGAEVAALVEHPEAWSAEC
jgi:hypothetical protein